MTTSVPKTLHALLHTLVDYAGLFPPAALPMEGVVRNYAAYRRSLHAWMLGRLVVPVSRLDEMADAMRAAGETSPHAWRVSALLGDDAPRDLAAAAAFNAGGAGALVDAIEVKAATPVAIESVAREIPAGMRAYVEIPTADDPRALVAVVGAKKLRAKIRTGGVTADAIPPADDVARFLRACFAAGVGFKATAGLHHPLCGTRALTYAPDAPRGVMHGFLNLFLAAAFLHNGLTIRDAGELLALESPTDVVFADDALHWRDYVLSRDEVATIRRRFAVSFGSCSFTEPVDDLAGMGLL